MTPYSEVRARVMAVVREHNVNLRAAAAELDAVVSVELDAASLDGGKYIHGADVRRINAPLRLLDLSDRLISALPTEMAAAVPADAENPAELRLYFEAVGRQIANRTVGNIRAKLSLILSRN